MAKIKAPDGVEIVVHESGRSDGRPIVLLHGYSANASVWSNTGPALAPRFRVLIPDQRGHGASGRTDDPKDFTLEQLADDVLTVADGLGLRGFTLVGHGMGGDVAQLVAIEHADRLEALVLVDTGPGPLDPTSGWAANRNAMAQAVAERGMGAAWAQFMESGIIGWDLDEMPIEIIDMWRKEFMKTAPAAFVGLAHSMGTQTDRKAALAKVEVPTLVVVGQDDAAYAEASRELAAAIPGCELLVMEDCGHSPQIMRAEEFNEELVAFLKRAVPAGRA